MMHGVYNGLTWMYHTITGGFATAINDAVLSGPEGFFLDLVSAFLAVFGDILNWIASAFGSVLSPLVNVAATAGLLGPVIALLGTFAFFVVIYLAVSTVVRIA